MQRENAALREEVERLRKQRDILKIAGHPLRTAAEKFAQIKTLSGEYDVNHLCQELSVSRSGYYEWCRRAAKPGKRAREDAKLRVQIQRVHRENDEVYGGRRITRELQSHGRRCGRHRVARLMRADGVFGRQRRRFRVRTTDSNHPHPIAPNRLAELGQPTKANEVWVSDITYVETTSGWLYLAAVMDLFSRCIVGWATARTLETDVVLEARIVACSTPAQSIGSCSPTTASSPP